MERLLVPSTESITPELFREHLADPAARPLLVRHSPEIAASEALRSWTWVGLRERIGDRKVDCRSGSKNSMGILGFPIVSP